MRQRDQIKRTTVLAAVAAAVCVLDVSAQTPANSDANSAAMRDLAKINREAVQAQAAISASGGELVVTLREPNDRTTSEALRAYGNAVRDTLRAGDFVPLLAVFHADQQLVDRLKATRGIAMIVNPQPAGFRISFTASDGKSRAAIHDFLQVPKTPENRAARHPGNNLGWDAQRQPHIDR